MKAKYVTAVALIVLGILTSACDQRPPTTARYSPS